MSGALILQIIIIIVLLALAIWAIEHFIPLGGLLQNVLIGAAIVIAGVAIAERAGFL